MAAASTLVATNSDRTTPQTCPDNTARALGIGIDKLALSFPISRIVQNREVWDSVYPGRAKAQDYLDYPYTSFDVSAGYVGPGLRCTVEYNPSRVIDPTGHSLCTTDDLFSTVAPILDQLGGRVVLEGDVNDALVRRLDVALDFKVADPQFFLTGLRPLHRKNGANPSLWFDEKSGAALSLRIGTSRAAKPRRPNHITLYDKHIKAGTPETEGVLRWEMSGRTWPKDYGGIRTLSDMTPGRIAFLALDRWDWSRMGDVVVSEAEFVDRVYATEWSTDMKRDRFLGQSLGELHGKNVFGSESAREEFNKTQKALGITASEKPGLARRLDLLARTDVPEMSEPS